MNQFLRFLFCLVASSICLRAQVPANPSDVKGPFEQKPADAVFAKFQLTQAPKPDGLLLKQGDRLAIIGDSITEQKMYSKIIETYLTVCVPELRVNTRQYGWSGETAEGFLRRMTNDCLRFSPTIATLCYGMNDHRYRTYDSANAMWYRENYSGVLRALKGAGARVVLGSPGCVGKVPSWTKSSPYTLEDLNLNLATFRNIDIDIARGEGTGFADVFWPMLKAGQEAQQRYGTDYAVPGKDGVHPGWAGQLIMAYCFLNAMGLDGDLGSIMVDLTADKADGKGGHAVTGFANGTATIRSSRYPFCAEGALDKDDSIRSGMTLVPFNQNLNRLMLVVKSGTSANYKITWGIDSKSYSSEQLAKGVNLADEFVKNPFTDAFKKVDDAVAKKQAYETRQIKTLFHGEEGRADMEGTAALTEKARQPLADAIGKAFVPVEHQLKIEAAN
ncbi:MAG: hypothetical protein EXS31_04290 [Pedosphaera sp.]|nr:hypothetical protein [Pedosphaera sp.]